MIFDAYKHGYQSIRAFGLLIDFLQIRLPWDKGAAFARRASRQGGAGELIWEVRALMHEFGGAEL